MSGVAPTGRIDPFVCPRGHHSITIHATSYYCDTCRKQGRETRSWPKAELVDLREQEPPLADGGES